MPLLKDYHAIQKLVLILFLVAAHMMLNQTDIKNDLIGGITMRSQ